MSVADDLKAARPDRFWRSLEELERRPDFPRWLHDEFPTLAQRWEGAVDRRQALKLLGAGLMMGGLAACRRDERILPYVVQPDEETVGVPRRYATSLTLDGWGFGVVAQMREGRPVKLEGNPAHPATLGAGDAVVQASLLDLYDPGRARAPRADGRIAALETFDAWIAARRTGWRATGGEGLAVLLGPETSPTLKAAVRDLAAEFPRMRWFRHDPLAAPGREAAMQALFGRPLRPLPRLERAEVVVSLDDDLLGEGPGRIAHAAGWAAGRRNWREGMNRLWAVASAPTVTSAAADRRVMLKPSEVEGAAADLLDRLEGRAHNLPEPLETLAADLLRAGPRALVTAGPRQTAFVQAAAQRMNAALGAVGETVGFIPPPDALPVEVEGLEALEGAPVETLMILAEDPVHSAPGDVDMAGILKRIPATIHLGACRDLTARLCTWHIPRSTDLESWGDALAFDGTPGLVQPMIRPLYASRTALGMLGALAGDFARDDLARLRAHWAAQGLSAPAFAAALKAGIVPGATPAPQSPRPTGDLPPRTAPAGGWEVAFRPDPYFRAGAQAGNLWLMELPRPLTRTVWGNAAHLSPLDADALGVEAGDVLEVSLHGRTLGLPAWPEPGHPRGAVSLTLGFGRFLQEGEDPPGVNVSALRTTADFWRAGGADLRAAGRHERILTLQHHHAMEGRDLLRTVPLADLRASPQEAVADWPEPPEHSLYPEWKYDGHAWAMVLDLSVCIGCNACVQACQAENNTPVVGPDEVEAGHEMHWLRVDRWYEGDPEDPETHFQPVPCMHCENAPCEVVCPVNATVHTPDALNAQVYNRCVGTRYCSQNCPYKVRRFNWLQYQSFDDANPLGPLLNPEVSVRSRGVMEKCTYCVQRIRSARIEAGTDDAPLPDGAIRTACQQVCPTQAIAFGDGNDPTTEVSRLRREPHEYAMLAELNTRPRTTYLAKVRNREAEE